MMAHAASDRFPLGPVDLNNVRDRISSVTNRFAGFMSELYSNPETAQSLSRLIATIDQTPSAVGPPSLPRQSPAAIEDMVSKLPKGLRVEDLKPPPAKRQKGKPGQSPSVQTPDPKTPSVAADSPAAIPGSAQSGKKATGAAGANKRKRQMSTINAPKNIKADSSLLTALPSKHAPTTQQSGERNEYKVYSDARNALENGTVDAIDALAAALSEFEAAQTEASTRPISTSATIVSNFGVFPSRNEPNKSSTLAIQEPSDDELFNEFLDFNGDPFPVPELLVDITDDYSPESIRTVGRSDSVGQPGSSTNWTFGPDHLASTPTATKPRIMDTEQEHDALDSDLDMDSDQRIEIPQSPVSRHYNGPLYFQ